MDARLDQAVPYVRHLRFVHWSFLLVQSKNYSECKNFQLMLDSLVNELPEPLKFLYELQLDLQKSSYASDFARELRKHPPNLKYGELKIGSDHDELIVMKALHEVRVYIHLILEKREPLDVEIDGNIEMLKAVHGRVTGRIILDNETT